MIDNSCVFTISAKLTEKQKQRNVPYKQLNRYNPSKRIKDMTVNEKRSSIDRSAAQIRRKFIDKNGRSYRVKYGYQFYLQFHTKRDSTLKIKLCNQFNTLQRLHYIEKICTSGQSR